MQKSLSTRVPREMSWLSFNERVLQLAMNVDIPLIERLRFLGIFSNNQDEFFKVQLASMQRRVISQKTSDSDEEKLLRLVHNKVQKLSTSFNSCYRIIVKEFKEKGIVFIFAKQLDEAQSVWLAEYFRDHILRHIVPIYFNEGLNVEQYLQDGRSYLIVKIDHKKGYDYAVIGLPDNLLRFIELPILVADKKNKQKVFMVIDEVIRYGLPQIFSGFFDVIQLQTWSMKISRNADFELKSHSYSNLLENLSQNLKMRIVGEPVRISFDKRMPQEALEFLSKGLSLDNLDCFIAGGRYRNFRDFINFPDCNKSLVYREEKPIMNAQFDKSRNVFDAISAGDILLIYPYHRFSHFTEFVRQAASDPWVTAILINVYRIAEQSHVIESLIDAAVNGKKVTVNVEVRARFDEERNISIVERLVNNGVQVTTGIPSLKVHCKICLVERIENGKSRQYANASTGNFNEQTAKIYSDISLFTKDKGLCRELEKVFKFLSHSFLKFDFKHLIVSPLNMRQRIVALIAEQRAIAKANGNAMITIKANNMTDDNLIDHLVVAAKEGVKVRLIVRSISTVVQNVDWAHPNLKVVSIVGRYLEHARVFWFGNDITGDMYISSADIMYRNIDERVEVSVPIRDFDAKQVLLHFLELQLADSVNGRVLDSSLTNRSVKSDKPIDMHKQFYQWLKKREKIGIAAQ